MTRDDALAILRAHQDELRQRGVTHAALFGSLARGEAGPDSDVDVLIEVDPAARIGLWGLAGITSFIEGLFDTPVDVSRRNALRAHVMPSVERDAIYAF